MMAGVHDRSTQHGERGRRTRSRRVLGYSLPPAAFGGASLAFLLLSSHARVSCCVVAAFVSVPTEFTAARGGGGLLPSGATGASWSIAAAAHLAVRG